MGDNLQSRGFDFLTGALCVFFFFLINNDIS